MDPDMALGGTTGQDFTVASDGSAGYSPQALPQHPHASSSASFHHAQTLLLLPCLSTTYLRSAVTLLENRPLGVFCHPPYVVAGQAPPLF